MSQLLNYKKIVLIGFFIILANIFIPVSASDFFTRLEKPSGQPSIDIIVGLTKPPYVIQNNDSGFELELIKRLIGKMGLQPRFIYVPIGRGFKMLDQGMGDAVMTINKNIVPNDEIRTKPYIIYQNVAISRKDNNISISSISDLSKYRLAAFQLAHKYLGPEYKNAIDNNRRYIELPNQFQQVKMLLEKRVDVVVMDLNIFYHMLSTINNSAVQVEFDVANIFPLNPYSLAFKDKALVEKFNNELDAFLLSQEYASLKEKYKIKN